MVQVWCEEGALDRVDEDGGEGEREGEVVQLGRAPLGLHLGGEEEKGHAADGLHMQTRGKWGGILQLHDSAGGFPSYACCKTELQELVKEAFLWQVLRFVVSVKIVSKVGRILLGEL